MCLSSKACISCGSMDDVHAFAFGFEWDLVAATLWDTISEGLNWAEIWSFALVG